MEHNVTVEAEDYEEMLPNGDRVARTRWRFLCAPCDEQGQWRFNRQHAAADARKHRGR